MNIWEYVHLAIGFAGYEPYWVIPSLIIDVVI